MRRFRVLLGPALLVGVLTGCSSFGAAPTTTQSLAQAQAAVNSAQAAVAQDQQAEQALTDPNTPQAQQCALGVTSPTCTAYANQLNAQGRTLDAKLARDQFRLQVAQDQLRKDENG